MSETTNQDKLDKAIGKKVKNINAVRGATFKLIRISFEDESSIFIHFDDPEVYIVRWESTPHKTFLEESGFRDIHKTGFIV